MHNNRDMKAGILLALIGIGVIIWSIRLQVGTLVRPLPGFFPLLVGCGLVVLSLILFVEGWLGRDKTPQPDIKWKKQLLMVACLSVYVMIVVPLGYILSTIFITAVTLRLHRVKSWKATVLVSLILPVVLYITFTKLLGVELPAGLLSFPG